MKKTANKSFILTMFIVVPLVLVCIFFGFTMAGLDEELAFMEEDISTILETGEVEDVEGYGVIAESVGYGFGAFAGAILFAVILLVGGYAFLLFIIALIARLIYAGAGKRLMAYRILMGIEYLLQLVLVFFFGEMFIASLNIIPLVIVLLVLAEIVYGMINTYTRRVCR